jgi:hypothetical protein
MVQRPNAALAQQRSGFESPSLHQDVCLRLHLAKLPDCRSGEGVRFSTEAPGSRLRGDISTGRLLPSHGRDRGSSPRRSTRTSRRAWVITSNVYPPTATFVRPPLRRRGGWPRGPLHCGPRGPAGRPVPGTVAHLGERLTGSQEVVGSTPIGSTTCCPGPDSGAPVWYTGDGECNSRGQPRGSLPLHAGIFKR